MRQPGSRRTHDPYMHWYVFLVPCKIFPSNWNPLQLSHERPGKQAPTSYRRHTLGKLPSPCIGTALSASSTTGSQCGVFLTAFSTNVRASLTVTLQCPACLWQVASIHPDVNQLAFLALAARFIIVVFVSREKINLKLSQHKLYVPSTHFQRCKVPAFYKSCRRPNTEMI